LLAGPCAMETPDHAYMMAEKMTRITSDLKIPYVFKTSFDKANRSSGIGFRGQEMDVALKAFEKIKKDFGCAVVTDYHEPWQAKEIAPVVDILQVPAFLCRQTNLLIAGAETGRTLNVKKAQFMAPWEMSNVVKKIEEAGGNKILLTERGTFAGYNQRWQVDMISFPEMAKFGYPTVADITHSVAIPGGKGTCSDGQREYAPVIGRAALAVGVGALFIEVHNDPDTAPCDGPNMMRLSEIKEFLSLAKEFDALAKANPLKLK
ncbi:MAG: 3-deoxy-8-phosphooctulonate synthase, partial [Alphaproteobacteria bacterium]|nr:3-deoxy-8-phosphooctulonate synthase [Alphaproteobacteria bacterium]